jgi:hypothetical protein
LLARLNAFFVFTLSVGVSKLKRRAVGLKRRGDVDDADNDDDGEDNDDAGRGGKVVVEGDEASFEPLLK